MESSQHVIPFSHPRAGIWRRLVIVVALVLAVQVLGAMATTSSVTTWYPTLNKAPWNPPAWVFGPVWTALYALMAWAGWRIWQRLLAFGEVRPWHHPALRAFLLQLAFNLAWSYVFFGFQQPTYALIDIVFLLASIVWMLRCFHRVDRIAYYSQLPYLLWVTYAVSLNAAIVVLNP